MRRTLLYVWMLVGVLLGGALPVYAQGSNPGQTGAPYRYQTGTLSALGSVSVSTQGLASVGMQITISASATVSFEGKTDDASSTFTALNCTPPNSTTAVTSTTASGLWTCNVGGLRTVQARVSTYGSGTIRVAIAAALSTARGGTGGGGITTAAQVIALWTGTCDATSVLGADGICKVISSSFSGITSGTNTTATMTLGSGSSLAFSGTGAIVAPAITAPATITGVVGSSAVTVAGATQTSSFPVLNLTQTWNNVATTFTGIKFNVTDTTSVATSLLLDLQVATISKLNVDKTGLATAQMGFYANTGSSLATFGVSTRSDGLFRFSNSSNGVSATFDTGICRNAAGVTEFNTATCGAFREIKVRSAVVGGTVPGISGCSAGTQLGGGTAGSFASGTTGACTVTLTFAFTAPTGWACYSADTTTPANLYQQSGGSATTAILTGTTVSGDVIRYGCIAY